MIYLVASFIRKLIFLNNDSTGYSEVDRQQLIHTISIITIMPWDQSILEEFRSALPRGEENEEEYYPPYHTILTHLFPREEHFRFYYMGYIRPDVSIMFLIAYHGDPVFLVKVKAARQIHDESCRASADRELREMFAELYNNLKIPILHGVSAIGTKLCFYKYSKRMQQIEPGRVPYYMFTAPRDRWNLDLLTPEGEQRLRDVVGHIKRMCRARLARFFSS